MRIINIHSFCFLTHRLPSILHIFSTYVSTPFLSLLSLATIFFLRRVFYPLPAVARTIKISCVINKTITHRNPFARSADINRRSILHAWGADREAHKGRKEGRKWDTVTVISGTDVRGDLIIVVSVTFVWPAKRLHARFIYPWHTTIKILYTIKIQYTL